MALRSSKATFLGNISIALSSLCVLHCLATPFILVLIPAISTFFSETAERILVLSIVPLSLIGFLPTWLRHKDYRLLTAYIVSIILILSSQFFLHIQHDVIESGSVPAVAWLRSTISITGALILAWAVFKNNRHTHYCTHPHHHQDKARPRPDPQHDNIPIS